MIYVADSLTESPGQAPAGYEWKRVPGRPRHWHMVRLPLSSAVWQLALAEGRAKWERNNMHALDRAAIAMGEP